MAASPSDRRDLRALTALPPLKARHRRHQERLLWQRRGQSDHKQNDKRIVLVPYQKSARRRVLTIWKCQRQTTAADKLGAIRVACERAERMINYRHFKRKRPAWYQATEAASISLTGLLSIFVIFGCWLASSSTQVASSPSDQFGRLADATGEIISNNQSSISDKLSPASLSRQLGSLHEFASANQAIERNGWRHERLLNKADTHYAAAAATDAFRNATASAVTEPNTIPSRLEDDADNDDDTDDSALDEQHAGQSNDQPGLQHEDNAHEHDDYNDYGTYIIYGGSSDDKSLDSEPIAQRTSSNSTSVPGEQQPLQRVFFAARQAREAEKVSVVGHHELEPLQQTANTDADTSSGANFFHAQAQSALSSQMSLPGHSAIFEAKKINMQSVSEKTSSSPNNVAMQASKVADSDISRPNHISTMVSDLSSRLQLQRATIIDGPLAAPRNFPSLPISCATVNENNEPFAPNGRHEHQQGRHSDHSADQADSAASSRTETRDSLSNSFDKAPAQNDTTSAGHQHEPSSSSGPLESASHSPWAPTFAYPNDADISVPASDSYRNRRQHPPPHHLGHQPERPLVRADRSMGAVTAANTKTALSEGSVGGELGEEDVKWLSKMNANAIARGHLEGVVSSAARFSDDIRNGHRSWARDNEQSRHYVVADQKDKSLDNVTPTADHQRGANDYESADVAKQRPHMAPTGDHLKSGVSAFLDRLTAILSGRGDYASHDGPSDNDTQQEAANTSQGFTESDTKSGRAPNEANARTTGSQLASAPSRLTPEYNETNVTGGRPDQHMAHNVNYWHLIWLTLPLGATFGNLLVILAVYRERSLQSITNYFIVSLAFADLFVGLVVMPFAVYVLVNEVWELSDVLCDIFVAVDVTSSTASILNLVAISIDRYLAIAHPIAYSAGSSSTRASLTIFIVWLISCCVGAPIILGLNTTPDRKSTLCILYNSTFIFWSSLTSFYVPCFIMIGLYWRIFIAIKSRTKKVMAHHNHQNHQTVKNAPPAIDAPPTGTAIGSVVNRQQHRANQATGQLPATSCQMVAQPMCSDGALASDIGGSVRESQIEKRRPGVRFPTNETPPGQHWRTSSCKRRMQSLDVQPDALTNKPNPIAAKSHSGVQQASQGKQPAALTNDNPITGGDSAKFNGRHDLGVPGHKADGVKSSVVDETSRLAEHSALGTCMTNGELFGAPQSQGLHRSESLYDRPNEQLYAEAKISSLIKGGCLNLARLAEEEKQMASKRCREHSFIEVSSSQAGHKPQDHDLGRANEALDVDNLEDEEEEEEEDDDDEACDVSGCQHQHPHLHDESPCNSADLVDGHQHDSSSSTSSSMSYDCSFATSHNPNFKHSHNQTSTSSHRCCRESLANCFNCEHHQAADIVHNYQLATPTRQLADTTSGIQRKRSSVLSSNFCCDSYATSTRCASHILATSISYECTSGAGTSRCTHGYCSCYDQLHDDKPKSSRRLTVDQVGGQKEQEKVRMPNGSPKFAENSLRSLGVIESARQKIKRRSMRLTNILRGRQPGHELDGAPRKISLDNKQSPPELANKLSQGDNVYRISGRKIIMRNEEPTSSSDTNGVNPTTRGLDDEVSIHRFDCLQEVEGSIQVRTLTQSNSTKSNDIIQAGVKRESVFGPSTSHIDDAIKLGYGHDEDTRLKPTQQANELTQVTDTKLTTVTSSTGHSSTLTDKSPGSSEENTNSAPVLHTIKSTSSKKSEISEVLRKKRSTHLLSSMLNLIHRKEKCEHSASGGKHSSHIGNDNAIKVSSANNSQLKSQLLKKNALDATKNQQQVQRHRPGGGSRRRREKNVARRERKATKTLAIVLGIFLICWTPFFTCNIIDGICIRLGLPESRPGMTAYLITSWLGYMNSCVNPIIYTIFNMEFRRAFKRILTTRPDCSCCS